MHSLALGGAEDALLPQLTLQDMMSHFLPFPSLPSLYSYPTAPPLQPGTPLTKDGWVLAVPPPADGVDSPQHCPHMLLIQRLGPRV